MLCCKKVASIASFISNQTKHISKIFHNINLKSKYLIYLLEYALCKIQYVGDIETNFSISLNNYRKDVKDPNALPVDKHFTLPGPDFNNNAKFTLTKLTANQH